MIFYLTFPKQNAFSLVPPGVPLFVNRNALFGKGSSYSKTGKLPRARGRWALDSGGFTQLTTYGQWTITPTQYVREVRECVAQVGRPDFAAIQDWMVEDVVLARTGGSVEEHQERTLESYLQLRHDGGPELADLWMPVLQGAHGEDYVRHFEMYLRHGLDLRRASVVGVGSVCRRHEDQQLVGIFGTLHGIGLRRLHGFGVKQTGIDWPVKVRTPRFPGLAHDPEVQREAEGLVEQAFRSGAPVDLVTSWLMDHPSVGAVTWEEQDRRVCELLYSADSAAWSDRARKWAQSVRQARTHELGPGWTLEAGTLRDRTGREVGAVRHELALSGVPGPLHPTQATPECSLEVARGARGPGVVHSRGGESCVSCPRWALVYRARIRAVTEPLGCWEETPGMGPLPPLPLDVENRERARAAHLAELWGRYGPGYFGKNPREPTLLQAVGL